MRNEFSSSPLEGLPRTIIIAGILLAVAIVVGAAPPWLSGAAATAVLVGSFVMNREATCRSRTFLGADHSFIYMPICVGTRHNPFLFSQDDVSTIL